MNGTHQLIIAAILSFSAAFLHIAVIFGGSEWYRFFGAGENMVRLSESGSYKPIIITCFIALVLISWGGYALSGAGLILKLPLLKTALCIITLVYLLRGIIGLILPFISNNSLVTQNSVAFWLISSTICCVFGLFYLFGTLNCWEQLQ